MYVPSFPPPDGLQLSELEAETLGGAHDPHFRLSLLQTAGRKSTSQIR